MTYSFLVTSSYLVAIIIVYIVFQGSIRIFADRIIIYDHCKDLDEI